MRAHALTVHMQLSMWSACRLYASEPPLPDFQKFMRLAAERKVLPIWWKPTDNVAIEKLAMTDRQANLYDAVWASDIIKQYGSSAPDMLRKVAESVYGWSWPSGAELEQLALQYTEPGWASCGQTEGSVPASPLS